MKVYCNFLVYRSRGESEEDFYVGGRQDLLRPQVGGWKIARGRLVLDQNVLSAKNVSIFFLTSTEAHMIEIKGLHHNAYRCQDSEETRAWYEEFLGLPLVSAFEIQGGEALHTFFQMKDGSCLAFFEVPGKPFDFKQQDGLDLHIALAVDNDVFERMLEKGRGRGMEVRGPIDHGFCRSIYFHDPNGYIVELTADTGLHPEIMDPALSKPHEALARWQAEKSQ